MLSIDFDIVLNPEEEVILNIEELNKGVLSNQWWSSQSSGIKIKDEVAKELEVKWMDLNKNRVESKDEVPNEFEVMNILDGDYQNIKEVLKDLELYGVETTIVTCGAKNVLCYNQSKLIAHNVDKVDAVDTTGAGDTFCAGVVYGLSKNMNLSSAINFGIQASRLSVMKKGVINSLPSFKDVLKAVGDSKE